MFLGDSFARWISIGSPQNKDTRAKNESKGILTADNIGIVSGHTMFIQIFLRFLSDLSNNRNDYLFQTQKEIFFVRKGSKGHEVIYVFVCSHDVLILENYSPCSLSSCQKGDESVLI